MAINDSLKLSPPMCTQASRAKFGSLKIAPSLLKPIQSPLNLSVSALLTSSSNGSVRKHAPFSSDGGDLLYKVLLKDDPFHTEHLVERVLPQIIPLITHNEAKALFHEAREKGHALVMVTSKDDAEFCSSIMISNGLNSDSKPVIN